VTRRTPRARRWLHATTGESPRGGVEHDGSKLVDQLGAAPVASLQALQLLDQQDGPVPVEAVTASGRQHHDRPSEPLQVVSLEQVLHGRQL
jgi:hypothetical protein